MQSLGDIGHLLLISSFVFALLSSISFLYFENSNYKIRWFTFASTLFYIHSFCIIGSIFSIYYLIFNNQFEYYYVFQHSSNELPIHYKISSFWEE